LRWSSLYAIPSPAPSSGRKLVSRTPSAAAIKRRANLGTIRNLSGAAAVVLIGVGVGVLSMNPPEYCLARVMAIAAALAISATAVMWLSGTNEPIWVRLLVAGCAALLVFVGTPYALSWTYTKEGDQPSYTGVLVPPTGTLIAGRKADIWIEIGRSGAIFNQQQQNYKNSFDEILDNWDRDQFHVEVEDGYLKVSTKMTDEEGKVIAEIYRNEWKVSASMWDRNYTKNGLEVKDSKGHVMLQVVLLSNRVEIQGAWWTEYRGNRARIVIRDTPTTDPMWSREAYPVVPG
jgi:hypothetical protein